MSDSVIVVDIQQDEKFCYEVHVMRDPSLSDPGCSMDDQVYCFQSVGVLQW